VEGPAAGAGPSTIVQLSDLHLGGPGELRYGVDPAANLRGAARELARMDLRPSAVVLSGDLSDRGEAASYEHLRALARELLEPFGCPVLAVLGNHDDRLRFRRSYLGQAGADDVSVPHTHVLDLHDVRLVLCDSHWPGRVEGLLGADQLAWLDEQLAGSGERPSIVVLHHPSVPRGIPRADDSLLADREALARVVARHRVAAVLCGHSHVTTASLWAGTVHAAAPAVAFQFDPSTRAGARGYRGSGFVICTIRDGAAVLNAHVLGGGGDELFDDRPR
jgi:3',5'-cyclic AMP phosphodiesterase CpdA